MTLGRCPLSIFCSRDTPPRERNEGAREGEGERERERERETAGDAHANCMYTPNTSHHNPNTLNHQPQPLTPNP